MRKLSIALCALLFAGCIEESPLAHQGTPRAPGTVTSAPQQAAPQQQAQPAQPQATGSSEVHQGGAVFDNALQVLAYKVDPPSAQPGQTVNITVALRVLAPIPADDMMFVHVDDTNGAPVRANGDHWPAGHQQPMNQWKVGEVVRDTFPVTLNGFDNSQSATIWMGFYDPQRDVRMSISNPQQVKNDGNNRYALGEIPIIH